MRILCVYATRQIDSNLFMSSTVFNGLQKAGFETDMVFWGYPSVCDIFKVRYERYFRRVFYQQVNESWLKKTMGKNSFTRVLYSFYRSFLVDYLKRPYILEDFREFIFDDYDVVLSFIPPAVSGYLAKDIRDNYCSSARLIQFWTDPLSLGGCNYVSDIPRTRKLHLTIEKELLSYADKAVFCYPLLAKMEKELHPEYTHTITWSDVGYVEHPEYAELSPEKKSTYKVGLFGSFPSTVRNIMPLLSVIKEFPNVQFLLRGDTDLPMSLFNYPNLDIELKRVPLDEVERLENECDILLILGNKGGIQIPGKVYYYANYPKPLVCICDSVHSQELKDYLGPLNRYILCDNNGPSIKDALKKAISELPSFTLRIPERLEPEVIARSLIS